MTMQLLARQLSRTAMTSRRRLSTDIGSGAPILPFLTTRHDMKRDILPFRTR